MENITLRNKQGKGQRSIGGYQKQAEFHGLARGYLFSLDETDKSGGSLQVIKCGCQVKKLVAAYFF